MNKEIAYVNYIFTYQRTSLPHFKLLSSPTLKTHTHGSWTDKNNVIKFINNGDTLYVHVKHQNQGEKNTLISECLIVAWLLVPNGLVLSMSETPGIFMHNSIKCK